MKSSRRSFCGGVLWPLAGWLVLLPLLCCGLPAVLQAQEATQAPYPMPGSIAGTIVDIKGDELVGANVRLSLEGHIPDQESVSNQDGRFSFTNVPPGDFKLTVTAKGFTTRQQPGTLHPGESYEAPGIVLVIAPATTEVRVEVTQTELAEEQIQIQEKQRVLGVIP